MKTDREVFAGEVADLRAVLSTAEGRRVFRRLMLQADVDGQTFNQNPSVAAWNEGRRSVMQEQLALIRQHLLDLYLKLRTEEQREQDND